MLIPKLEDIKSNPSTYCRSNYIKKNYPDFYDYLNIHYKYDNFSEKLYNFFYPGQYVCKTCGKSVRYKNFIIGYHKFCSVKCANLNKDIQEKIKQTNLERYGVERVLQNSSIKERMKESYIKRYNGIGFSSNKTSEKIKQTCIEKYGVDNPMKLDVIKNKVTSQLDYKEIRSKIDQTCLQKYDSVSPFGNKEIQEKIKHTNLEKYGVENPINNKEIQRKIKQTNLEKYGVEYVSQNKIIQERIRQTNLNIYGSISPFGNKEIQKKSKQTCIKKYGVENPFQSDIMRENIKQANLKKYGVEYVFQNEKVKQKIKQTNLEKYGGIGTGSNIIKEKIKQTNLEKYGTEHPMKNKNISLKTSNTKQKYNIEQNDDLIGYTDEGNWICKCPHPDICNKCIEKFYITKYKIQRDRTHDNNELCTKLFPIGSKENGISNSSQIYFDQLNKYFPDSIYYKKSEHEYKTGRYSLDFYIPSLKVDIEFNGTLYHMKPSLYKSTDINPINNRTAQEIWDHDKERKEYIESKGIKVITIWEDELPEPKEISNKIKNLF